MFLKTPKTFSLLSIGMRGVGKTVFLAGSYAEMHANSQSSNFSQLRFECQDSKVQTSIENVLRYITQTNLYPPPTIKNHKLQLQTETSQSMGYRNTMPFSLVGYSWRIPFVTS